MDKPIFYRSIGIIKGLYLPSNENLNNGSLLTEQGLFPATLKEDLALFLNKKQGKKGTAKTKTKIEKQHNFVGWLSGLPEAPYYQFYLINRIGIRAKPKKIPHLFVKEDTNKFITQGFIKNSSKGKVLIRIQKNPRPERSSLEIANSINYLKILNCPGSIRNSQFWLIESHFKDGMLYYNSGEILAYAKDAKRYI